jgi:hypothetical protein
MTRRTGLRPPLLVVVVAAVVGVGAVVTLLLGAIGGVGPVRDLSSRPRSSGASPSGTAPVTSSPSSSPSPTPRVAAPAMLEAREVARLGGPGGWRVRRTDANTAGDGLNSVCQQRRFADPRGYAALVRVFRGAGAPRRAAVQTVEVSRSVAAARRTYRTTVGWYAGCRVARLQVLRGYRVEHVGDRAEVLTMRRYGDPVTSLSVAVARTGSVVTSTVATTVGPAPQVRRVVGALADAVRHLCTTGVSGGPSRCVSTPTFAPVPPPPAGPGEERGILAIADLPPVGRVDHPWVGTRPAAVRRNPSATACDRADFAKAGARTVRTRTYLVPQARLPERFGLSETYGRFATPQAAQRFVAGARRAVQGCERRDVTASVGAEHRVVRRSPQLDASRWLLRIAVSRTDEVAFRVGFVRVGRSVAQVTFTPSADADMSDEGFGALLERAGDRLRELPTRS